MAKPRADGGYTATVSIGTGRGNAAHARVMRFSPFFETAEAALRYATSEGLNWARRQPAWSTHGPWPRVAPPVFPSHKFQERFQWQKKN